MIDFWAVATRQRTENGRRITHARAAAEIENLRRLFRLLPPNLGVFDSWQRLVLDLGVIGKQTHDTHLVATMQVHSVGSILTFNVRDFTRFPGITVIDPAQV